MSSLVYKYAAAGRQGVTFCSTYYSPWTTEVYSQSPWWLLL